MSASPSEKREAAAIRRRWITLGEILAVAAVVISGLTFWNSYSERTASQAERAEAEAVEREAGEKAASLQRTIVLRATPVDDGARLTLAPADPGQIIQSIGVAFPTPLAADAIDAAIEPRIEAGWIEDAARAVANANPKAGGGDRRLPVAITTRFVSGGETIEDVTLYDVGYRLSGGGLFDDADVRLIGLSRIEQAQASNAQARLDATWQARTTP